MYVHIFLYETRCGQAACISSGFLPKTEGTSAVIWRLLLVVNICASKRDMNLGTALKSHVTNLFVRLRVAFSHYIKKMKIALRKWLWPPSLPNRDTFGVLTETNCSSDRYLLTRAAPRLIFLLEASAS